ncbi:PAAR domain-containing protein [Burkholderia sp. Ac-20345]|uniref:PAAR domain-containing protein n=1 Tax=Burkholderia sp. Ac-20345 TaxID=2703891 RepID=UPI00197B1062|nr:PAAR domain-containing protein [Burkholderia sp. Ac-20345]MBN3777458.1 PAAR domain-containing protein [Burkholderia sp. Ac-20345]
MFEQLVAKGSRTTTGGYVASGSSAHYDERGNTMARDGDQASCGNCKGLFSIRGSANAWLDDGKAMVKDWDWVLCPCRQNRVRASPASPYYYSTGGGGQATTGTAKQSIVESAPIAVHDEQYVLRDAHSRQPLANVQYRIRTASGQVLVGITDATGHTQRVTTTDAESLHLEIVRDENAE